MSSELADSSQASDDTLARDVLAAAQSFTGQVTAMAAELRIGRPELAGHLDRLAAEVAATVLEGVRTWPMSGGR